MEMHDPMGKSGETTLQLNQPLFVVEYAQPPRWAQPAVGGADEDALFHATKIRGFSLSPPNLWMRPVVTAIRNLFLSLQGLDFALNRYGFILNSKTHKLTIY